MLFMSKELCIKFG